jgi:ABC-2 type transport system permease protein/lipopolysaccharide transport system permease protein
VTVSPAGSPTSTAVADILAGARAWHLWGYLGWHDIRRHYRRSTIGPLWITISMGVLIGSLGYLYTHLFHQEISEYLPFLASGFILWSMVAGMINEGSNVFVGAAPIIKQVRAPLSIHVYRLVWRSFITFFHNIWILALTLVLLSHPPSWLWLLAIPGLILIALNGLWVGLLLGTISARFRDVPPIMASVVQIAFFLTPIIWKPDMRPDLIYLVNLNPFHHLLHVVRAPLLNQMPAMHNWIAAIGITLLGWVVAFAVYRRFRGRIAYWV